MKRDMNENPTPFGIYVHWPFCERKCPYCDFYSKAGIDIPHEEMLDAYLFELEERKREIDNASLISIYFGGGTPSLMRPQDIAAILDRIGKDHSLDEVEITLEANPSSTLPGFLKTIRAVGVNRLSIGVQSFQDEVLQFLGRIHTANQALQTVEAARETGFDNLGIDLILASKKATLAHLEKDLEAIRDLSPEHVSSYILTIEDETPFGKRSEEGEILLRPEEEIRRQYETCRDRLLAAGYEHYEISNYAMPGLRSRHNQLYWAGNPYLGLGPGAHSYLTAGAERLAIRSVNHPDIDGYLEIMHKGSKHIRTREEISEDLIIKETIITALRRKEGLGLEEFRTRTGRDLLDLFQVEINAILDRKWVFWANEKNDKRLKLTTEGIIFSDDAFIDFF